jgi:hypothetical protein
VVVEVTILYPEVNALFSISEFPVGIVVVELDVLGDTIINEHVTISVLTIVSVNDKGNLSLSIQVVSGEVTIVLLEGNDLTCLQVNIGLIEVSIKCNVLTIGVDDL